jgi:hypothetical protein
VSTQGDCRYYVDDLGNLWRGPVPGNGKFRFHRFDGVLDNGNFGWSPAAQMPGSDWEVYDTVRAIKILDRYKKESGYV